MAKPVQKTAAKPAPKAPPPKASPKPSTALAKTESAGLPAAVAAAAAQYAGAGISDKQEDNIVPLVYLLQANSKPAMKGHERYVEGAVGGSIWLRNAPPEIQVVDGDEGILFQPCHFSKCWIEWQPERKGFAGRHAERPEAAELREEEDDNGNPRQVWRMPNGNSVNESREFAGFVYAVEGDEPLPYTIPFSGSGHTVAKQWMTSMRNEKLPGDSGRAPLFANLYRLKTVLKTKNENSWYMFEISKEGPVQTVEEIERGAALYQAFEAGQKQSAAVEDVDDPNADVDGATVNDDAEQDVI
jgi:hypothetical protein